ncbi:MAG TPA: matrixin family metalloprotease [Polyangiaceae bacterium]|nr:matrixin family metalloprotease [Polyangiaceae bacterium]
MSGRHLVAAASLLGLSFVASGAHAYCRTTTCDESADCTTNPIDCCTRDGQGCDTNGKVLYWPSSCVSWSVQEDGSLAQGIDAETTEQVVGEAFLAWTSVTCAGAPVSIDTAYYGRSTCNEHVFDNGGPNANVWMFRDDEWTHTQPGSDGTVVNAAALAVTTVTFDPETGEMLDADVEFNSALMEFSVGDQDITNDLLSVATHEAGHFLGLDHSNEWDATMAPGYFSGSTEQRTLGLDDQAGLCAAYPQGRDNVLTSSCDPLGGSTIACMADESGGCSWASGPRPSTTNWLWPSLLLIPAAIAARRYSRRGSV